MARNKMAEDENRRTVSTCGKSRNSTWGDGSPRNTTKGMTEVITITHVNGKRTSVTSYEAP